MNALPGTASTRRMLPACALVAMSLVSSCREAEPPPIPTETFTEILIETHLAYARHQLYEDYPQIPHDSILVKYGVDSSDYQATLEYYTRRPRELMSIYSNLADRLNAENYGSGEFEYP